MAEARPLPESAGDTSAEEHRLVLIFVVVYFLACGIIAAATGTWVFWLAVGVPALVFPFWLASAYPASLLSRLVVAAAPMGFVLLGVQQTFGFAEAHFSFFVMITALAVYRDWQVLIFAAALIIVHHIGFSIVDARAIGFYIPNDRYGAWRHVLWHLTVGLIQVFTLCYLTIMLRRREALNAALGNSLDREKERADRDPLTGLSNRHHLKEIIARLWPHADDGSAVLCVIDLDHFKIVNDRYGHAAGDEVLRTVADIIRGQIGPNDFAFRLGGEEFLVLMSRTTLDDGAGLAERIRCHVASRLVAAPKSTLTVTVSIGVAAARAHESFDETFKRADEALYLAKNLGRNRIELWSEARGLPLAQKQSA